MDKHNNGFIHIDVEGLKKDEKLDLRYDSNGRLREIRKKHVHTLCWIATAYYGDPFHPDVVALRAWRDTLKKRPDGFWMRMLDAAYQAIGKSQAGQWWIHHLTQNPDGIPARVSHLVIRLMQKVAGIKPFAIAKAKA